MGKKIKRMSDQQVRDLWDLYSAGKKNVEIGKELFLSEVTVSLAIKRLRQLIYADVIIDQRDSSYMRVAKAVRMEKAKAALEKKEAEEQKTEPAGMQPTPQKSEKSELPESYQKLKDAMDGLPKLISDIIEYEVNRQISPVMEELEILRDHAKTSNWLGELQKKFQGKSEVKVHDGEYSTIRKLEQIMFTLPFTVLG